MKAKQIGVTLRGDRNQCGGCSFLFNSTHAFDKHRTGVHGVDRRCLSDVEMRAKGMFLGEDGFWRGSQMPEGVIPSSEVENACKDQS